MDKWTQWDWNTGKVNVWLNGNKVLSSNSDTIKLSSFDYRKGDKLEITDEDTGIIQIRTITFKCKGNEMSSMIFTTMLRSKP